MNLIPRDFFFDDVFSDLLSSKAITSFKCDIYEHEGKYFIETDLPGVSKKDISLTIDNGYLTLKVSKSETTKDETKKYLKRERIEQKHERTFYVGDVLIEDVDASFENGVLKITFPKEEVKETKKAIEIK